MWHAFPLSFSLLSTLSLSLFPRSSAGAQFAAGQFYKKLMQENPRQTSGIVFRALLVYDFFPERARGSSENYPQFPLHTRAVVKRFLLPMSQLDGGSGDGIYLKVSDFRCFTNHAAAGFFSERKRILVKY